MMTTERVASTMVARSSKKTKLASTNIESLRRELLTEILAAVGASSVTDLFNVKLSCKTFLEASEDPHVYRHLSLDKYPMVDWRYLNEKQQDFLRRCVEYQNPEIIYRKGVIDLFSGTRIECGLKCLQKAINLNHSGGAKYVVMYIALVFSGNIELKEKGLEILERMRESETKSQELTAQSHKIIDMLRSIWVKMPLIPRRPIYCHRADNHKKRTGSPSEQEEEEYVHRQYLRAYTEFQYFFSQRVRSSQHCLVLENFLPGIVDQVLNEFS